MLNLYFINEGKIDKALEQLTMFSSFASDKKALNTLKEIFINNCHTFFKNNPKESINLSDQVFKDIDNPPGLIFNLHGNLPSTVDVNNLNKGTEDKKEKDDKKEKLIKDKEKKAGEE